MERDPVVTRRQVKIINTYGLHMRPASKFVQHASTFQCEVWVHSGETKANGKSLLEMLGLAVEHGATIELETHGPDAQEALSALAELVTAGFHMDEEGA